MVVMVCLTSLQVAYQEGRQFKIMRGRDLDVILGALDHPEPGQHFQISVGPARLEPLGRLRPCDFFTEEIRSCFVPSVRSAARLYAWR